MDEARDTEVTGPTSGASPQTEDLRLLGGSESLITEEARSLITEEAREREASCEAALLCAEYFPSDVKLEETALYVDPEYFLY